MQPTVKKLLSTQALWAPILKNGRFWLGAQKSISEKNRPVT